MVRTILILFASTLLSLSISCRREGAAPRGELEWGDPVPPFIVRDLDGRVWDSAELKGRILLLHFWGG